MTAVEDINYDDLKKSGYDELIREFPSEIEHFCIGCSPTNPIGLKMRFFGDRSKGEIVSRLVIPKEYCGFPIFTHGGIITLILDEIMAHLLHLIYGQFGVTKSITVDFLRPVLIGKPIFVRSVLSTHHTPPNSKAESPVYQLESFIHAGLDQSGKICAKGTASMVILPDERFEMLWKSK